MTKDQLEHLPTLQFSWTKLAELLGTSIKTIQRRREEFQLSDRFEKYSSISDEELDSVYKEIAVGSQNSGFLIPNLGRRRFIGALRSRDLRVQRWRVSECIRRCDPVGTSLRWRTVIHRRKYFVPAPNSLWHIDSCHKLIRYKMVVHVCIDGKTRLLVYCSCHDNNKAETVLTLFKEGSAKWGIPSRVRSDYGMETYQVGAFMIEKRGANRSSIITRSSVHNSRVERTHRDVFCGVLVFFAHIFQDMEIIGILDPLNDSHSFCIHHVFIPRINGSLEEFVLQMDNSPVSTEHKMSPIYICEKKECWKQTFASYQLNWRRIGGVWNWSRKCPTRWWQFLSGWSCPNSGQYPC